MKLYALHTIHRTGPKGPEIVAAKSVFSSTEEELADLAALGAAREATKEEIAVAKAAYKAKNGGSAEGFDEATTEKVEKPATEKVEKPATEKVEKPATEKVEKPAPEKAKGGRPSKADKTEKADKADKAEGQSGAEGEGEADI